MPHPSEIPMGKDAEVANEENKKFFVSIGRFIGNFLTNNGDKLNKALGGPRNTHLFITAAEGFVAIAATAYCCYIVYNRYYRTKKNVEPAAEVELNSLIDLSKMERTERIV